MCTSELLIERLLWILLCWYVWTILITMLLCSLTLIMSLSRLNIKVMSFLKSRNYDVIFLQETHLSDKECKRLCRDWVGNVLSCEGSTKSRGVAILINKHLQFTITKEFKDRKGRILIVQAEIQGQTLILANIYAPNLDEPIFFGDLECSINRMGNHPVILGGISIRSWT
uniref:exodeoxyribonuclease III n=1 Tax=Pygocentrus nattereri TaxID=42514 RepID=A0AAR2JS99_PYGNA